MEETLAVREELPKIFKKYKIKSFADAPCGDLFWMKEVDLSGVKYMGFDIVGDLIKNNQEQFSVQSLNAKKVLFAKKDIVKEVLPKNDLVLCRDCLVHLSNKNALKALENFAQSSKYLLSTTFPGVQNEDIVDGMWRRVDLTKEPFNLPRPLLLINEKSKEDANKYLGLWDLSTVSKQGRGVSKSPVNKKQKKKA